MLISFISQQKAVPRRFKLNMLLHAVRWLRSLVTSQNASTLFKSTLSTLSPSSTDSVEQRAPGGGLLCLGQPKLLRVCKQNNIEKVKDLKETLDDFGQNSLHF